MGTTYIIANTTKRQYFDPGWMGNSKYSGLLYGMGGHALAILLFREGPPDEILESWAGDALHVVGDDLDVTFPALGIRNSVPGQGAQVLVRTEYDDITLNLIALLLREERAEKVVFERADQSDYVFLILANIALYLKPNFARAFEHRYGKNWQLRYRRAIKACAPFCPMPMTAINRKNAPVTALSG